MDFGSTGLGECVGPALPKQGHSGALPIMDRDRLSMPVRCVRVRFNGPLKMGKVLREINPIATLLPIGFHSGFFCWRETKYFRRDPGLKTPNE
jgi:hypothetical protein